MIAVVVVIGDPMMLHAFAIRQMLRVFLASRQAGITHKYTHIHKVVTLQSPISFSQHQIENVPHHAWSRKQ